MAKNNKFDPNWQQSYNDATGTNFAEDNRKRIQGQKDVIGSYGGGVRSDMVADIYRQIDDLNNRSSNLGGGWLGLQKGSRDAARAQIAAQVEGLKSQITKAKAGFGALDAQEGPSMTPQMTARLKALDSESQRSSLAEDPLFQGDRSMMVSGGASALAGLGSAQKSSRFGTGGQGSVQDIYDRLGGQLSQLGQQSRQVKESKRDIVASSYQSFADAEKNFENARKNAEAAIISGNLDQAYALIQKAADAEAEMRKSQDAFTQNLIGQVIQGGATAAGFAFGGPAGGAAAGAASGALMGNIGGPTGTVAAPSGDTYTNFSSGATLPGEYDPFAATAPVRTFKK